MSGRKANFVALLVLLFASLAMADVEADISDGAFGSVHKNKLYSIDTVSGKATLLATIPDTINGIDTSASSDGINSLALNTEAGIMYFTSNKADDEADDSNKTIFYYDMVNDEFGVLVADVTQLGVSFSGRGLGSAGAAFYNGALYFGIETSSGSYPSEIYSLPVSANGKSVTSSQATLEFETGNSSSAGYAMQWGDFSIGMDGSEVKLYIGCYVYTSGNSGNKWQVWDLGTLASQGDESILINKDKQFGQIGFDLNGNYYFVFGNTNKFAVIDLNTGDTGTEKNITVDGSSAPDDGSYDAAGIIPYYAEVRGGVWEDYDGDGVWDSNEPGIENATVSLYEDLNNNGQYDSGERLLATDTTDSNGRYRIYNLIPGNFVVRVTDNNGQLAGGAYTTAQSQAFYVRTNQQKENVDFGYRHVRKISGRVYEDVNGDSTSSDFQARGGVRVSLYQDDGDGVPDGEDTPVQSVTTDSDGGYEFDNASAALHWVVVDSKTVTPSAGFNSGYDQSYVWAQQTYGAAGDWGGALCDVDGDSDTDPEELTSSGPCFGGRYGNRSDDASSLTGAEHVAKVVVGSEDVSGVDFGFSFNVVTNVNDQDDDPDNARTCQGCLRQFIQNANAISGANAMRFVPVVPTNASAGGGSWWQITVNGNDLGGLPAITDDATTINGAAYDYTNGTSTRGTNEGSISAPGPVGVSQIALDGYAKPELEVNVNDAGVGLAVAASNTQIARLALYNSEAAYSAALIQVTSGSSNEVRDSFIGPRADGSDPQGSDRARAGVTVEPGGQMDVRHNYVAHLYNTGVELMGTGTVEQNFIEHIGMDAACGDGVSFEGGPERSRDDVKVQYNYIHDIAAYGVESWRARGAYYIYENTITDTGKGDSEGNYCGGTSGDINTTERGGIRIFGTGSLVERNVVYGVPGHAIVVVPVDSYTPSLQNTITQNSTYANGGLSIDLDQGNGSGNPNGDGVTPNDGAVSSSQQNNGMDYPIFTSAVVSGSQLRVQGYVGKDSSRLSGTFTIEVYKADDDGNNNGEVEEDDGLLSVPHGEGRWYLGSCETNSDGSFDCLLDLSSLSGDAVPGSGDAITGTATDGDGNTSEFGANKSVFVVEKSPYAGKIVINEVLYRQTANSADENDEFIEIYNAGDGLVNLEGWRLGDGNVPLGTTDGVSYQFPSVTLGPGEYAVIWVGNQYDERQDAAGAAFQAWLGYAPKLNNTGDDVQLFDAEGNAVDYVAYGSGSAVDPPPIANFWDDTYQSGLAGADLGQSISLTPNGVDGDTSACWEKTTSGDADGRCSGYLPTVDSDDYGSRVTSVGANNNGLVGVTVSGYVYHDLEPDGTRGGGESWSDGPDVYVKLVRDGAVVQVVAVAAGSDGAYAFTAVAPGDYTLVVDDNNDTGDDSPNAPAGWLFVNPPDGSRVVTVGTSDVSGVDFGLFHGARVLGTVFRDTGDGAGTANDAVQNGEEPGVAGVSVTASDGANARTVQTGVEGDYAIYIPADWGSVTLSHALRPASGLNVNGSSVYQAASWQEATATDSSAARFNLGSASDLAGQELVGYNFGAVFASAFRPDQSGSATSPGAVTYAHTYQPGTQGTVVLSRDGGDYSYQVRVDQNCDGDFEDSGEDWQAVSPGENPTFSVDDGWPRNPDGSFRACGVEVRVLVPDGEPEGAVDIAQVSAALQWADNADVADSREVVDTTTVRTLGTLRLEKQVRNVTQNSDFGNQVEGKPGDVLEYCISYRNIGSENVTDVVISDPIPFFSDFLYGAYTSNTDILWYDASGSNQNLTADPGDGDAGKVESGIVSVTAESTLEPGQGGKVCYQVEIR